MTAAGGSVIALGVALYLSGWTIRLVAHGRYRRGSPVTATSGRVSTRLRWTGLCTAMIGAFVTAFTTLR